MNKLSLAFFTTAALCVLGGMTWGVVMAASQDHSMMPAHAHLNLMGWASLAIMGTFYALTGRQDRLGWANFWISSVAVAITIPSLAFTLAGNPEAEKGAIVGSLLAILGGLVFMASVISQWRAPKAA